MGILMGRQQCCLFGWCTPVHFAVHQVQHEWAMLCSSPGHCREEREPSEKITSAVLQSMNDRASRAQCTFLYAIMMPFDGNQLLWSCFSHYTQPCHQNTQTRPKCLVLLCFILFSVISYTYAD